MHDEPKHALVRPRVKPQRFFFYCACLFCIFFLIWIWGLIGGIYAIIYNVYLKNYHLCISTPVKINNVGAYGLIEMTEASKRIQFQLYVTNTTSLNSIYIEGPRTSSDPDGSTQFLPDIDDSASFVFIQDVSYYKGTYKMSQTKSSDLCENFWKYTFVIETSDNVIVKIPLGNQCISPINWV